MDPLNSMELTLKTPNQSCGDIQLKCQENWTVGRLKEHLQDVYPSKPKSSSQKLIYLGKLLQDHLVLKEIITSCARTLHIVCPELETISSPSKSTESNTPTAQSSTPNTDGLRQRIHNSHQNPSSHQTPQSSTSSHQSLPSQQPQFQQFQPEQLAQQQQQQQYMSQFQQYHNWHQQHQMQHVVQQYYFQMQQWQQTMNSGQWPMYQQNPNLYNTHTPPLTPSTPITPSTPSTPSPQQQQQPQPADPEVAQPQPQPPLAQPQDANRNVPMNAGPGGAIMQDAGGDDNNPANRDWLDWVYMSMRAVMLLSIIYFYSSTSRFLLVAILGLIVYFYQAGWFTPRRPPPAPPVEQPVNNRNEDVDNDNDTEGNSENELNTEQQQTIPEPPQPGFFRVLLTFVSSFVTSLVPATPPVLQQN